MLECASALVNIVGQCGGVGAFIKIPSLMVGDSIEMVVNEARSLVMAGAREILVESPVSMERILTTCGSTGPSTL